MGNPERKIKSKSYSSKFNGMLGGPAGGRACRVSFVNPEDRIDCTDVFEEQPAFDSIPDIGTYFSMPRLSDVDGFNRKERSFYGGKTWREKVRNFNFHGCFKDKAEAVAKESEVGGFYSRKDSQRSDVLPRVDGKVKT